ncbi:MmpS family transport accessory protein [Lentzea sp. NPDC042327]|uniref:MmpS family transport accessory protein n=1 Tax=Lentzea sp. NPDC042327 TaxID=3154801 RepID=UPI0034034636
MSYPQPPHGSEQHFQQQMPPGQPPQYAPPQYGPPPKKKAKKWPWVIGGVVALFVIIGLANGGKTPAPTNSANPTVMTEQPAVPAPVQQPAPAAKRTVIYEITGAGQASSITYTTDGLTSTQQEGDVNLPWSKTIELPAGEALQMVSMIAQAGQGTPEIAAKITVDGKVVKEGKSTGQYAVVSINENIGSLGKK